MSNKRERIINIDKLISIRDSDSNLPAVRLQAVQTLQKLITEDNIQTLNNIETLKSLRDSDDTSDGVRIQVIQTLQKIFDLVDGEAPSDIPTAEDIMAKIRGNKK